MSIYMFPGNQASRSANKSHGVRYLFVNTLIMQLETMSIIGVDRRNSVKIYTSKV